MARKNPAAVADKLRNLHPWQRYTYHAGTGFTYQSCRFCKRSAMEGVGLWKYGVRHYACDECRGLVLSGLNPKKAVS